MIAWLIYLLEGLTWVLMVILPVQQSKTLAILVQIFPLRERMMRCGDESN